MSPIITLIILHCIHFTVSRNSENTYIGDNSYWWRSTSDFTPSISTQYGTLLLRDALYMEFDIVYHGPPSNDGVWQNIFRVGFDSFGGGNCYNHNSRYPSLWMLPGENKFHFSVSETSSCGKQWGSQPPAITDFNYHVIIHYNDSHIFISLNNVIYIDTTRTPTMPDLIGSKVYIWMNTDVPEGAVIPVTNATLSNIVIVSYWYNDGFTMPPTYAPTQMPSVTPTKHPTNAPTQSTLNPTQHPSVTPTNDPSLNPTKDPTLNPSANPTANPSMHPTIAPTKGPFKAPTRYPSESPSRYPSSTPSLHPTHIPTFTPSLQPTHNPLFTKMPSSEPTDLPTDIPTTIPSYIYDASVRPTWSNTENIVTLIQYIDDTAMNPILTVILQNLIYICIALVTCFAICCPVLFIWCCCYIKLCPEEKEGDDTDESESEQANESEDDYTKKSEEEFLELSEQNQATQKTESSAGSEWMIPIKRSIRQKEFEARMEDPSIVPRPAFDSMDLMEGSRDMQTDEEYIDEAYEFEQSSESVEAQQVRDRNIRVRQRQMHQQRFAVARIDEMAAVDMNIDTMSPVSELERIAIYRNNEEELEDEDDEKQVYLRNKNVKHDEGDLATEPEFAGHGGMGVTRMDLEDALDDGLSIVPSTGQYSRTTEPVPSSKVSDSTLSNNYKPYKRIHIYSNNSGSSHSTPTTIDEEKEIDERWSEYAINELKIQLSEPIQHIPQAKEHDGRKKKLIKVNRNNGNPFIPKEELKTNEYRGPKRHYLASSNGSSSSSSSPSAYTDEYYDEESEDDIPVVHNLQMQMNLARRHNQYDNNYAD